MSTNTAPAGWHPDPAAPGTQLRWWDGVRWTEHVHPQVQQPVPRSVSPAWDNTPPWEQQASQQSSVWQPSPGWDHQPAPQNLTFVQQNRLSLIAGAVVAAYIVIALTSRIVLVGILPIVLSVRAMRRREPLAPFAVGAAIIAVIIAIAAITGH